MRTDTLLKGGEEMEKELIKFEEVDSKEFNGWAELGLAFGFGMVTGTAIILT